MRSCSPAKGMIAKDPTHVPDSLCRRPAGTGFRCFVLAATCHSNDFESGNCLLLPTLHACRFTLDL